ncbi:hypothetical protein BGW41_000326 [Actinomortierella wolfii]|nr:hypothetical protein BGW41_000326 [Actinomortierella wolfii]
MNARDTRIEDRPLPRTSTGLPLVGGLNRHADSATRKTTPGPQDLIPAKRRKRENTATPASQAVKRNIGGGGSSSTALPFLTSTPLSLSSTADAASVQQRPPLNWRDSPVVNTTIAPRGSHSVFRAGGNPIGPNGGSSGSGLGGSRNRQSAGSIIVISDDEGDFQTDPRAKKRQSFQGTKVQQAIEIPSSSEEEDMDKDDSDSNAFMLSNTRKISTPTPATTAMRSSKSRSPVMQRNSLAAPSEGRGRDVQPLTSRVTVAQELRREPPQPQSQAQHMHQQQILRPSPQQQPTVSGLDRRMQSSTAAKSTIKTVPKMTAKTATQVSRSSRNTLDDYFGIVKDKTPQVALNSNRHEATDAPSKEGDNTRRSELNTGANLQSQRPTIAPDPSPAQLSAALLPNPPYETSSWTSITSNLGSNILAVYKKVNQVVGRTSSPSSPSPSASSSPLRTTAESSSNRSESGHSPLSSRPSNVAGTGESIKAPIPVPTHSPTLASTPVVISDSPAASVTLSEANPPTKGPSPRPPSPLKEVRNALKDNLEDEKVLFEVDFNSSITRPPASASLSRTVYQEEDNESDDYHYDDDHLLGGELEIPPPKLIKTTSVNYTQAIQESYMRSQGQLLRYQKAIKESNLNWRNNLNNAKRATTKKGTINEEQLKVIVEQVYEANQLLRKADWDMISRITSVRSGVTVSPAECKAAFEELFCSKRTKEAALKKASKIIPIDTSTVGHLLAARALGSKSYNTGYVHDMICKAQAKALRHATSFNFGSGSIVDMALKRDGSSFEVLVGSIATQDIYNRSGNLLLCDFKAGVTIPLTGHEIRTSTQQEPIVKTVNDVKLSYSKRFFISASDDKTSKVWKTGTGDLVATQTELNSRVTRIAVCEASLTHEDVFATCSDKGGVILYGMDSDEDRVSRQSAMAQHHSQRCVSCISFGQGYYWNILAVGMEGIGGVGQGQLLFYDANVEKVSNRIQIDRQPAISTAASVSCISFSSSGEHLLCGTSGGSGCDEDDNIGDGIMRLFDVKSCKQVAEVVTNQEDVNLVGFSPCETYLISCSVKNDIVVFDRRFLKQSSSNSSIAGTLPGGATRPRNLRASHRRDTSIGRSLTKPLHSFYHDTVDEVPTSGVSAALWWPSGPPPAGRSYPDEWEGYRGTQGSMNWLVTGGGDGVVRAWDLARATEDAEAWKLDAKVGPIACVIATPDFDDLVIGGDTSMVCLYTMNEGITAQYERNAMRLLQRDE